MSLSFAEKHLIAARAATIYERAAAAGGREAHGAAAATDSPALAFVRTWTQTFSPGDADAFARRLTWDGLETGRVIAAASSSLPPAGPPPEWTAWLDRAIAAAADELRDVDAGAPPSGPGLEGVPFPEIWSAFRLAARRALIGQIDARFLRGIRSEVLAAFERQLMIELSLQGALACHEQFQREPAAPGAYRTFVSRMLRGGLGAFFAEYAPLARLLSSLTADWVAATREFLIRLDADRSAIANLFAGGADPGDLIAVAPGLSDPHHGRRRVAGLEFASGLRLVYKPRSVGLENAFGDLLRWVNRGIDPPMKVLRVLDRGTHGWVEFAAQSPASSRRDVERFYEQSGALLCVAHVLRARDLHMENLVATADGPVVIDLEMLLQPISRSEEQFADAAGHGSGASIEESSLATAMVTAIDISPEGEPYDSGGLKGQSTGPLPFPRRVWMDVGTDAQRFVDEPTFQAPGVHRVMLGGVAQNPDEFTEAILRGFSAAYRYLLEHRAALIAPDGPLGAFASCSTRVLPRPTNQYAMLSHVLATPKYQRDGLTRSTAMDILYRGFSGSASRPELWPMVIEERRALERLDIPYFTVGCDGTEAMCDGRLVVRGYFSRSGLEAARARVQALSERDLVVQNAILRRVLSEGITSRFSTEPPSLVPREADPQAAAAMFADHALWVAHELLSRADSTGGQLLWKYRRSAGEPGWADHNVYDGTLGPALLFAAAGTTSGAGWMKHAHAAIAPLRLFLEDGGLARVPVSASIGGLSGLGSLAYGLGIFGVLAGDERSIAHARTVAAAIPARIDRDDELDVTHGSAGAVMALLALHAITGDPGLLDIASACGDRLVGRQTPAGGGSGWPSASGPLLAGFAHGAAGITAALSRLFVATGDARYREAAEAGCLFLHAQFLPERGNYGLAASADGALGGDRRTMTAWCHGAPGVALGIASALDICPKAAILSEFAAALHTTARLDPAQADHVCCGTLGRADVLLTVGRMRDRSGAIDAAHVLTGRVVERARQRGHFRLVGQGVEYRVFDPGFFRGLSGIGYHLLRMAFPSRLPSVAGLEPPPRSNADWNRTIDEHG